MQPKESKSSNHLQISLLKSFLRLLACVPLAGGHLEGAAALFFSAELLGILEEII